MTVNIIGQAWNLLDPATRNINGPWKRDRSSTRMFANNGDLKLHISLNMN